MKKLFKKFLQRISGKIRYQRLFEGLHSMAIKGMNYGKGGDFRTSGELFTLGYIKKKLAGREDIVLFDVGAHVGHYSLELSNVFTNKTIRIYSFEPSKQVYDKMLANVKNVKEIIPNNLGLSDTAATMKLFTNTNLPGLASMYQRRLDHIGITLSESEEIELTTIDNFCSKHKIDNIDFLKLDVEGHEWKVLQGASKKLSEKKITFIQFEFGGCNIDSRTYFQDFYYLLKDDFDIYRIVENGLFPISTYKEEYEIFTTINYLAERKTLFLKNERG
ncbi:MAG: FkbM family methyltransferase [Chitinophagales bacterium]